ncbi:hypothetical protein GQ457_17G017980 [Hibiscus cannabinus]
MREFSRWFLKPPILGSKTINKRRGLLDPKSISTKSQTFRCECMRRIIALSPCEDPNREQTGHLEEPPWLQQEKLRSNGCNPASIYISTGISKGGRDMDKLLTDFK